MTTHTPRLQRYYNELIGRSRAAGLPLIREAQRDLHRDVERQFPFTTP